MTEKNFNRAKEITAEIEALNDTASELSLFQGKIFNIKIEGDVDNFSAYSTDLSGHSLHAMRTAMLETVNELIEALNEEFNSL